ncbi:MAG TPA: hypothetical protein PL037_02490 [Elusimicrobiales bacterium]|nr:hypothetical protein [Elusimicrobiales bacterium]
METGDIDKRLEELWMKASGKEYSPGPVPAPRLSEFQVETVQFLKNSYSKAEGEWKRLLEAKDSAVRDLSAQLDEMRAHLGELKQHYREAGEKLVEEEKAAALRMQEAGELIELQKKNHAREILLLKELLERSKSELSSLAGRLDAMRSERDSWREKHAASAAEQADLKDAAASLERRLGDAKEAVEKTLAELLSERQARQAAENRIKEAEKQGSALESRLADAKANWDAERKEWRELWDRERSVWETHRQEFAVWESRLRSEREAWSARLKEEESKGLDYAAGLANVLKESSQWSEKVAQILKLYALKGVQLPQTFVSADGRVLPLRAGRGLARVAAIALAGILLLAGTAWKVYDYRTKAHFSPLERRSLDVPDASGLALSDAGLWLADWNKGIILKDRSDLATIRVFGASGGEPFKPAAICPADEGVWVLDMAQLRFIRKGPDGRTLESVKTPGPAPQGLAWDGYNLWCFDAATGLLYRYALDPRNGVEASFSLAGAGDLIAMQWVGDELWTLDAGARLARFSAKNGIFRKISSQLLKNSASAFWAGGGYFWSLERPAGGAGTELARYKVRTY